MLLGIIAFVVFAYILNQTHAAEQKAQAVQDADDDEDYNDVTDYPR